jgi:hypothetical protein
VTSGSYLTNDPAACANCHVMREHAPQEAAPILAESIDFTRQGQLALRETRSR